MLEMSGLETYQVAAVGGPREEMRKPEADRVLEVQNPLLARNMQGCRPEDQAMNFSTTQAHLKGPG